MAHCQQPPQQHLQLCGRSQGSGGQAECYQVLGANRAHFHCRECSHAHAWFEKPEATADEQRARHSDAISCE